MDINFSEFDKDDFDPIEYINRQFPDENSLVGLDSEIARVKDEIAKLDREILDDIHEHALLNKKTKEELNETHDLTQKLISELRVAGGANPDHQAEVRGERADRAGNVQRHQDAGPGQEEHHAVHQLPAQVRGSDHVA